MRKLMMALALVMVLTLPSLVPKTSAAAGLDWQPRHTWVFAVGTLSWKHKELFDSFPTESRRDAELVSLFRQRGVPDNQIVYLQDKHATQAAIDSAFAVMLPKLGADDLLIIYYCGHGDKDDGTLHLASYDEGDDGNLGWAAASVPRLVKKHCRAARALWMIDCCYSGMGKYPGDSLKVERFCGSRYDILGGAACGGPALLVEYTAIVRYNTSSVAARGLVESVILNALQK